MGDTIGTNKDYKNAFDDFKTYIDEINNNNNTYGWNSDHRGYLVNHSDFEQMRNKILKTYEMRKNSQ